MGISNVSSNLLNNNIVNNEQQIFNSIKESGSQKTQLKKGGQEFETVFITKMLEQAEKTIDKKGGIFGEESKYVDTFKGYVYGEVSRQWASNPHTSIGLASAIYKQMEKYVSD